MRIWNQALDDSLLDPFSHEWLKRWENTTLPPIETIWGLMDEVWDEFGLDNGGPLSQEQLAAYYSHPVWTLNGIFTQVDPTSRAHRNALARHIHDLGLTRGADYGGGSGTLAEQIVTLTPGCSVDIIEPFPSALTQVRVAKLPGISFASSLSSDYDFVIAQDVLEHAEDPISLAGEIVRAVRIGGFAVFANCFHPVIKCHLPETFHLRHTFSWVIAPLGVRYVGSLPNAPYIMCYRRTSTTGSIRNCRNRERLSRAIGPTLNSTRRLVSLARRVIGS